MEARKLIEVQREQYTFTGMGEIYTFTTLTETPDGFDEQAPYVLALVKLDEGAMVTAQITDLGEGEAVAIGDRVEMVTRKLATEGTRGMIIYGYKFRKVLTRSN
ncbi:MAG TPA: OB-fold domain-containing protein [Aggregatilineales bacterium]|nr:OB-fold domain-containing protein [Anaerolineae bacterium]HUN06937.1 OB-fold domain-containing protein [Aggregatilineales bacterium]